jgi:hypothetical protein
MRAPINTRDGKLASSWVRRGQWHQLVCRLRRLRDERAVVAVGSGAEGEQPCGCRESAALAVSDFRRAVGERLFVWFSDNRRVEIVRFMVALFVFGIIIIVGVSRGLRVTYDGDETPIDQPVGNVLRHACGHVGFLRMPRMSC